MTQADRVLKAARAYNGTCQSDWLSNVTPDHGPTILRVAARINELRDKGFEFEILHDRGGTRVYRLVEAERGTAAPSPDAPPPVPSQRECCVSLSAETLFDAPAVSPSTAHWRAA